MTDRDEIVAAVLREVAAAFPQDLFWRPLVQRLQQRVAEIGAPSTTDVAASAMRALADCLERCRADSLGQVVARLRREADEQDDRGQISVHARVGSNRKGYYAARDIIRDGVCVEVQFLTKRGEWIPRCEGADVPDECVLG